MQTNACKLKHMRPRQAWRFNSPATRARAGATATAPGPSGGGDLGLRRPATDIFFFFCSPDARFRSAPSSSPIASAHAPLRPPLLSASHQNAPDRYDRGRRPGLSGARVQRVWLPCAADRAGLAGVRYRPARLEYMWSFKKTRVHVHDDKPFFFYTIHINRCLVSQTESV